MLRNCILSGFARGVALGLWLWLGAPAGVGAAVSEGAAGAGGAAPDFEREVLPVLYHHCFACHSEKQAKPKGGLRLDSAEAIRAGEVLAPGKPDESPLLTRALLPPEDEDVMPPLKGGAQPLSEPEREVLRRWIAAGADFGGWARFDHRGPVPAAVAAGEEKAEPRELAARLDALIAQHHEQAGTRMNAPVDDAVFLRRVYLDVIGRIPTLEEQERFSKDEAADKRARLIRALLDSPGHTSHMFNWKADQLRLLTQGLPGQPGWLYDAWVKESLRARMPADEFARRLITAEGYLWENGAVGFYVRDLGMPLDHMSNLTRVFLGTRMECAQCHDHPLEPVTQKDFFQMAAFTSGVTNLCSSSGFSEKNVKQWPEIQQKLDEMQADSALRQGVSRTISYLKRLTTDTPKVLTYPETYEYDKALRKKPVEPRTLFGLEAGPEALPWEGRREAFARWLVSPQNPRFATNLANRLWKKVMGAGLVEPVDSLSTLPQGGHAALLDFVTLALKRLKFDERAYQEMLLNTRLYQSGAERETPGPGVASGLRGPLLRRLSAEQIWDSCLALIVQDVDERASLRRVDNSELDPERLRKLTRMTADEILQRARDEMEYRKRNREYQLRLAEQSRERAAAREAGDEARARELQAAHARENDAFFSPTLQALQMGGASYAPETDPRWKGLPHGLVRASEIPVPLPLGHFLRQFGQSDRREIDAYNRDPNTTHPLALMNGELTGRILEKDSALMAALARRKLVGAAAREALFHALLTRAPEADELAQVDELTRGSATPELDLLWALLNSPEFLFTP